MVLGLDASSGAVGVALSPAARAAEGKLEGCVAEYRPGPAARPAASLLAAVASVLARARCSPRDLDGLAVAVGPGSYAGVRAAVATAKALAWAADVPLTAVGSLEAWAFAAGPHAGAAAVALDARRGRVYGAVYRCGGGLPAPLAPPALWPREQWPQAVARAVGDGCPPGTDCALAGPGWLPADVAAARSALRMLLPGAEGPCPPPDGGPPPAPSAGRGTPLDEAPGRAGPPGESERTGVPAAGLDGERTACAVAVLGSMRLGLGLREDPMRLLPAYVSEPDIGPARGGPGSAGRAAGSAPRP